MGCRLTDNSYQVDKRDQATTIIDIKVQENTYDYKGKSVFTTNGGWVRRCYTGDVRRIPRKNRASDSCEDR